MAWSPYQKLARRGVPLLALDIFMLQVIFRHAASRRRDWDQLKIIKPHTLKRLPKRIRRLADQIELLNSDPKLDPIGLLLPEQKRVRRNLVQEIREGAIVRAELANELRALPAVMRRYADFLDFISKLIGQIRRHPYNPLHHCLISSTEVVHQSTGAFMYAEIADLASALIAMAGSQSSIDPANLGRLYRDNPHLRSGIAFN